MRIANIFGRYVLKTEHLHFGYWPGDLEIKLENLPQAQDLYSQFLLLYIPVETRSILDVGCGTGHNAELLISHEYHVDCVSPSTYLTECTRKKLSDRNQIFECFFENLVTDQKYDLILFSESFQYIKMNLALEKCIGLFNPGGHIMIVDFFRIPGNGTSPMGGGHRLRDFQTKVKNYPLENIIDIDITVNTEPNLKLVDEALQQVAIPLKNLVTDLCKSRRKMLYHLAHWTGKMFFRRKMRTLNYKYFSGSRNAENFIKFKTYRLFLFKLYEKAECVKP